MTRIAMMIDIADTDQMTTIAKLTNRSGSKVEWLLLTLIGIATLTLMRSTVYLIIVSGILTTEN